MERVEDFSPEKIDAALAEVLGPIADLIAGLDEAIGEYEKRLAILKESRRRALRVTVAAGAEKPGPKENGAGPASSRSETLTRIMRERAAEQDAVKLRRVLDYARAHPGDDLIANRISAELKGISLEKISKSLEELQERGIVRFDRVIKGGGKAYRLAIT